MGAGVRANLRTALRCAGGMAIAIMAMTHALAEGTGDELLPTGQTITPLAPPGAVFQHLNAGTEGKAEDEVSQAVTSVTSPDGHTLLVLTSGYNLRFGSDGKKIPEASTEHILLFDISAGPPKPVQSLHVANADGGIAFAPDGRHFYVGGGSDDVLHVFALGDKGWAQEGTPIALGHKAGNGIKQAPSAAGVAVSADGAAAVVADRYNDAVTIVDTAARKVTAELDLRPGRIDPVQHGVPGGEDPDWVAIKGNDTAYVSSQRDRQVVVIALAAPAHVAARIKIDGTPNRMVVSPDGALLYVAADNSDTVAVIDTATNAVRETIAVAAPPGVLARRDHEHGAAPNGLTLSSDGATLYVSDGGTNAIALVPLDGAAPHHVAGLIPTGWYPNSVSLNSAGTMLYVINGRSDPGPNTGGCSHNRFDAAAAAKCQAANRYVLELSKAGLQSLPVPDAKTLAGLTATVARNDGFSTGPDPADTKLMDVLRSRIKHVIYVVKENRTYDQVLGDLKPGNGDPSLTLFGAAITPNEHDLAHRFVTLDNFHDVGEVSGNGWPWSTAARETDVGVKSIPMNYAGRGAAYDVEGTNRNINVALPTLEARRAADPATPDDPDLLPGTGDVAAPDGVTGGPGRGHLWDAALRAGLSVRNYGFFLDLLRYAPGQASPVPLDPDPFASKTVEAFPTDTALMTRTDPYFRGFDDRYPDFYREREWEREFAQFARQGNLPSLLLVRLMNDHMGSFADAIDGVNTPEKEVADNDYALGRLVEAVAKSRYKDDTLIFVLEDDAQDGPDHVDVHRSIAFVAGPYVKHGAVASRHYSTVNMLRTIEDVLGVPPLSLYDAYQRPMSDIFDLTLKSWSYDATPSAALKDTKLPLAMIRGDAGGERLASTHDAAWWAAATQGYDWSAEDKNDAGAFNRVLWSGLAGDRPYPDVASPEAPVTR